MTLSRAETNPLIQPPTNCPSCSSVLVWIKDQLFCKNNECDAKSFKQLEHFAKTLKIKGLGPNTIEKLDITNILDIYDLPLDYISVQLNSERVAIKLHDEIEKSKTQPLNTVLPAFGISLVGKSATDKLSQVAEHISDINAEICKRAGLGPKVTENLLNWIETSLETYIDLPFSWEFSKDTRPKGENGVVCITGKLKSYPTKAAAKAVLESLGYTVKDSLTKDVTILVNESGVDTAKTIKAANDGVRVITNLNEIMENFE
jgi:NAD-dependent DNA ligase